MPFESFAFEVYKLQMEHDHTFGEYPQQRMDGEETRPGFGLFHQEVSGLIWLKVIASKAPNEKWLAGGGRGERGKGKECILN